MLKSDLIKALEAIPGDPDVVLEGESWQLWGDFDIVPHPHREDVLILGSACNWEAWMHKATA